MKRIVKFVLEPPTDPDSSIYLVNGSREPVSIYTKVRMLELGEEMPNTIYLLTYTLAPKHGKFLAGMGFNYMNMKRFDPSGFEHDWTNFRFVNCLIPREWEGKRFNRKIRFLSETERSRHATLFGKAEKV